MIKLQFYLLLRTCNISTSHTGITSYNLGYCSESSLLAVTSFEIVLKWSHNNISLYFHQYFHQWPVHLYWVYTGSETSQAIRPNKNLPVFRVIRPKLNLLVKPRFFSSFLERYNFMHFERWNAESHALHVLGFRIIPEFRNLRLSLPQKCWILHIISFSLSKGKFDHLAWNFNISLTEKLSLSEYLMNMLQIFCELHCSQ